MNEKLHYYNENNEFIANLNYNEQDKLTTSNFINKFGDSGKLEFKYDQNENIDSFVLNYDPGYMASYDEFFDFDFINDSLIGYQFNYDENGNLIEYEYVAFHYAPDTITQFIHDVDSEGVVYNSRQYILDQEDRISKILLYFSNGEIYKMDSFVYNINNDLEKQYLNSYSDEVLTSSELIHEYVSDNSIQFDNILNPLGFWHYLLLHRSYDEYISFMYPIMFSNKIESQTNYSDNLVITWYYSMITSNKNVRVSTTPISVYPNPSTDKIRLDSDKIMSSYELYNMNGQLVQSGNLLGNTVDVETLPDGQYTLTCSTKNEESFFAQFVKK